MSYARSAFSCLCFAICVLFAALWVRSNPYHDSMSSAQTQYLMESWRGQMTCHWSGYTQNDPGWGWTAMPAERFQKHWDGLQKMKFGKPIPYRKHFGFGRHSMPKHLTILFPHWFPTLLAGAAAVALKPKPRTRFSLRELFVASTVVAGVLGAITYLAAEP